MDSPDDGREDARDLCVFVDENKSIGDITVSEMDHTETDPLSTHSALDHGENCGHGSRDPGGSLDSVEALTGIGQMITVGSVQKVLVRVDPQLEHVSLDFAPKLQTLHHERPLCRMVMSETGSTHARPDGQ
jgi:hypothetical protein